MTQAVVVEALKKATLAVSADNNGDYATALEAYQACLTLLDADSLLSQLTRDEDREKIASIVLR